MLIEGAATAQALYPPAEVRPTRAADVLVQTGDLIRTDGVLRALGYRPTPEFRAHEAAQHDRTWTRGGGQVTVEVNLHTSFRGVTVSPAILWDCWWGQARSISMGHGLNVAAPSLTTTALIVAVLRDRSAEGSVAVRDLDLAIELLEVDVWRAAAAQARHLGCESTMAAGVLRHPKGASLLLKLGISAELTRREALYRHREAALATIPSPIVGRRRG